MQFSKNHISRGFDSRKNQNKKVLTIAESFRQLTASPKGTQSPSSKLFISEREKQKIKKFLNEKISFYKKKENFRKTENRTKNEKFQKKKEICAATKFSKEEAYFYKKSSGGSYSKIRGNLNSNVRCKKKISKGVYELNALPSDFKENKNSSRTCYGAFLSKLTLSRKKKVTASSKGISSLYQIGYSDKEKILSGKYFKKRVFKKKKKKEEY